jgi:hypothetical protein
MITLGQIEHNPGRAILRGRLLVSWKQAQRVVKQVVKLQPQGFYVEVDELSLEEARLMEKVMPPRTVDLPNVTTSTRQPAYLVSVYGPRTFTGKLFDRYFVVQVDNLGNPGISRPMSGKDAWAAEPPRNGGSAFICKVVGVKKRGLTDQPASLLHKP